jgi:hypothetical protein|tara:strand:+ start:326 stop:547 length:222 start_codon:yes stop_codon:yes gene_type:complete
MNELRVTRVTRVTAGFNPKFRIEFSDGFNMRSTDEYNEATEKYYTLMYDAINNYEYGKPIGGTSEEDFYNHNH